MKSRRLNICRFLTVCSAPALAGIAAPSARAATRSWDGKAATNVLNTAANWSDDTLPTAAGDIAQWNGTVAGPLSLTSNGASSGSQTLSGIISGTGTINQTAGSLTLTGANTFSGTTTIPRGGRDNI